MSSASSARPVRVRLRSASTLTSNRGPDRSPCARPGRLLVLCLAALPALAAAQSGETVAVTAARVPQRVDRTLADVTVIPRERVEAAAGRTLPELLAAEAGVQFWSSGGLGKTSSVSVQGLESRHTLLLVDGVRHGSATTGTPSWDNIPLDTIERIEIVRGPLSGLYGSDAVGGVVQVFTRRGRDGLHPRAVATAGSRSYGELAGGASFGTGAVDGSLRLQHRRTDGFSASNPRAPFGNFNPDDDGFEQTSVSGRLGLRLDGWRAEVSLLRSEGRTRYDDGPGADARAELRTEVLSAQAAGPLAGPWRTVLRLARSRDEYETLATASAFTALGTIGTTQHQLSWEHQVATPLGTLLALAERVEQEVRRPGAPFAVGERAITGIALGLNGESTGQAWQASARHDRNSQFGSQTTGSLAYGVDLVAGLRASASYGTSFVAPSFNQLYFPNFGNPDLRPEEGRHSELALAWRRGAVSSRLAWIDHRIRGYISSGPLPANIPRVRVSGISASAEAALGAWTLRGSVDSLEPVNATAGSASFGRILPRRVQDAGRLQAEWRGGAWTLGGTLSLFGERFDDAANSLRLGGFGTLDLSAQWRLARDWALAARLNNATGKVYETVYGYNQPGREAYLTLRWEPR